MPFCAVVARQLSAWPFAARTAHLFLLLDPSLPDQAPRGGLLRAMQQAYFSSDGYSQTRAVREAALAAHYVLRHHNRDALPISQINAATAVAAVRGDVAFVALAGHAAAFAWHDGQLTGQRGILRLPRPLGLEQDPLITLWSTQLEPCDHLVLVCGATWRPQSSRVIQDILSNMTTTEAAEQQLADALGDSRPAGVLVVGPGAEARNTHHLRLVPPRERAAPATMPPPTRRPFALRRWLTSVFGVALLATVILAAFTITPDAPRHADEPTQQMTQMLPAPDRVDRVAPSMAVRLGPSAMSVVDLAVSDEAVYTLDVSEGSVRAFAVDQLGQQPTPGTLLARAGTPLDTVGRRLAAPVAMTYAGHALIVIDQSRTVVQIDRDRRLTARSVPTSTTWQALGALGADPAGRLVFLDSGSRRLLQYPPLNQRAIDPPRLVLDATSAPRLAFEHVAEVVGTEDNAVIAELDDGRIRRFGADGSDDAIAIRPADGHPVVVRSMTSDHAGGLYLADPANARVVHIALDGTVVRELRDPTLGGVRQIQTSPDGNRLYALVATGVLVFDIPAM